MSLIEHNMLSNLLSNFKVVKRPTIKYNTPYILQGKKCLHLIKDKAQQKP